MCVCVCMCVCVVSLSEIEPIHVQMYVLQRFFWTYDGDLAPGKSI